MESSEINISEEDKIAVEEYKGIVNEINRIKNLLSDYTVNPGCLKEETYFDLLKKINYLRNKQCGTNKKIRTLYKKLYKRE